MFIYAKVSYFQKYPFDLAVFGKLHFITRISTFAHFRKTRLNSDLFFSKKSQNDLLGIGKESVDDSSSQGVFVEFFDR